LNLYLSISGEIIIKVLLGQFALIFVVWLGMASFFEDMGEGSKVIFYLVTSWLLLLVVLIIKEFIKSRGEK